MAKKKTKSLSDQLRILIEDSGLSRYAICKRAEMDPSHLHRFMAGEARITNDTLDRLGEVLALRLTVED